MELLAVLFILVLIVVIAAAVEIHRELHHFCVTEYTVTGPKLTGLRDDATIVFLSDLHNCIYGRDNKALLQAVRDAGPDLILIGGDMLVGKEDTDFQPALDLVKRLPKIGPVYYALGNHEGRLKEEPDIYGHVYDRYKADVETSGICFYYTAEYFLSFQDNNAVILRFCLFHSVRAQAAGHIHIRRPQKISAHIPDFTT